MCQTMSSQQIPISAACTSDSPLSHYPWFMTIGEDRTKDQIINWKLCNVWKLPFCKHRAIKLTQNCVSFTNPYINLLVSLSVIREYHPKVGYFNFSTCCSVLQLTWSTHCFRCLERHKTSVFLELISIPAWSHVTEHRSCTCWRPCSEDASGKKQTVDTAAPNSDTSSTRLWLSIQFTNSYKPRKGVVAARINFEVQHPRWTVVI